MTVMIKGYEEVKRMADEILVKEFEDLIRKGAGPDSLRVRWIRKEILRRLGKVERIHDLFTVIDKIIKE